MMKGLKNKKIIICGIFSLTLLISLYGCLVNPGKITASIIDNDYVESQEEVIELGDSHCKKTATKCSYTCSGYQNKGSKPSNCRSGVPSNGGCAGSSFYVSCSNTGGVYCYRTSQTTSCTECEDGYELNNGTCEKIETKVESVSGGGYAYLAADEKASFSFSAASDPSDADDFSPKWSATPEGLSGSGKTFSITVGGTGVGSGAGCKETKYTVTATQGGVSKSATATVCKYCTSWHGPIKGKFMYKQKQNTSKPAKGCFYFEGEQKIPGGYSYTGYYTRCCSSPPSSNLGACYGNEKYLGIATKVEWLAGPEGDMKYKYSNINNSNECVLMPDPVTCTTTQLKPEPDSKETEVCEEETILDLVDNGQECGGNQFYQIKCTQRIYADFDMDDDGSYQNDTKYLLRGQGFKYGVKLSTVKTCVGTFNPTTWKDSYNKITAKINTIPSNETDKHVLSRKKELENILNDILDIVNKYNNYILENSYDEGTTLSFTYKEKGVNKTVNAEFDKEIINEGSGKYIEKTEVNLGVKGLKNPSNYTWNNNDDRRIVKLIPKISYIEKFTGDDTYGSNPKAIDGGNKIYTSYYTDVGTYPLIISVNNLGGNESSITNNKCSITVGEETLLYRTIDVNNPFINSSYEIGKNWLNTKYSFTNTIKSDTWSKEAIYNFILPSEDIASLKESYKNNKNDYPYLGLCNRIPSSNYDSITKRICEMLKD